MKAFYESDATAKRNIVEHLKTGLKCPFAIQYIKMKMMENEETTVEELDDGLCIMEDGLESADVNSFSVIGETLTVPTPDQLTIGQQAQMWMADPRWQAP